MIELPATISFVEKTRYVTINMSFEVVRYYQWFLRRRFAWSTQERPKFGTWTEPRLPTAQLHLPKYGAHITVIHGKTEKMSPKLWKSLKSKYDNKKVMVIINPNAKISYSPKRGGFWTIVLPVWCEEGRAIKEAAGFRYKWPHLTIGNTKK